MSGRTLAPAGSTRVPGPSARILDVAEEHAGIGWIASAPSSLQLPQGRRARLVTLVCPGIPLDPRLTQAVKVSLGIGDPLAGALPEAALDERTRSVSAGLAPNRAAQTGGRRAGPRAAALASCITPVADRRARRTSRGSHRGQFAHRLRSTIWRCFPPRAIQPLLSRRAGHCAGARPDTAPDDARPVNRQNRIGKSTRSFAGPLGASGDHLGQRGVPVRHLRDGRAEGTAALRVPQEVVFVRPVPAEPGARGSANRGRRFGRAARSSSRPAPAGPEATFRPPSALPH